MSKKNPLFLIITLLILAATLLSACGSAATVAPTTAPSAPTTAPTGGDKSLVGVVLPTKDEPRWLQDQAVFVKAGWTPLFSQGDSAKEKANVEALILSLIHISEPTRPY